MRLWTGLGWPEPFLHNSSLTWNPNSSLTWNRSSSLTWNRSCSTWMWPELEPQRWKSFSTLNFVNWDIIGSFVYLFDKVDCQNFRFDPNITWTWIPFADLPEPGYFTFRLPEIFALILYQNFLNLNLIKTWDYVQRDYEQRNSPKDYSELSVLTSRTHVKLSQFRS